MGEHRYRRLSKNFKWCTDLWKWDSFKVVVPFCSECHIYGTPENGTFELTYFISGKQPDSE